MKSFLFSWVMRPDNFFLWCSRVLSHLSPASVFQTVALLLLDLVVLLFQSPVNPFWVVFVLLFASLFISLSLPGWLFPSLLLLSLFFLFFSHPLSVSSPNLMLLTIISGLTVDVVGRGVVVVVMVDNTRSLGQHGNDAVSFGWSFIDILIKQIKLIYSLESSLWPTHHFLFILIAMGAMGNIANVWQEHVSGPGDRFQASTGPVPCSSCVWHTHVVTLSMSWEMNEQHFPKRRKVPLYTVHVIPTAVHTSGFPT